MTSYRLPSPPTWACYDGDEDYEDYNEDEDSFSESGSDGRRRRASSAQWTQSRRRRNAGPTPRSKSHQRERVYTLRPILTIQRSQGFVWNQVSLDLFVPLYIKDRYLALTSPPNSTGFISTSVSSTNSALTDYEVEVVEIRVQEGEFDGIIP
ncbi:hypothetical protein B0H14DRAFT_3088491 [Mycena olivaceomarginata]|nr:hypothetical protein B0H14DRAFT_3088491 [Mycena olivaceomarginata]